MGGLQHADERLCQREHQKPVAYRQPDVEEQITKTTQNDDMKNLFSCLMTMMGVLTMSAQMVSPLPDEAWNASEWISVADAPEVQGRVDEHTRAADGS